MFKKLFGKSSNHKLEPESIIPKENYSIFKLELEGGLAFATINAGYDNYCHKKAYPWYAVVVMEIQDRNENGHPTNEEAKVLNDLEDRITQFLNKTQTAHKIGRVTRNGEKDIIFYLSNPRLDPAETKIFFDSMNVVRPMNFTVEKDESWKNVKAFLK
jgi:hypothetical protein